MFRLFLLIVTGLLTTIVYGQKKAIELEVAGRYDKHADYTTRYFNRSYTNDTKLWGNSFGFSVNYISSLYKHVNAKVGAGYYNLGIDKIRQATPFNIIATGRDIDYHHPSGIAPLFGTKKYHYDNLSFTLGLAYESPDSKRFHFIVGGDFTYLYTFSQLYHISYDNIRYRTNSGRTLGVTANSYFGILKRFCRSKNYLNPKIVVPVYQHLHGDLMFGEGKNVRMNKWFNGIGLAVAIGRCF